MRVLIRHTAEWSADEIATRVATAGYDYAFVHSDGDLVRRAGGDDRGAILFTIESSQSSSDSVHAVLERLRQYESDSCVIIIGPEMGVEKVAGLLRNGVYDYLVAPVRPGRLEEALRAGLGTREAFLQVHGLSERLRRANVELAQERDALQRWNDHLIQLNELGQRVAGARTFDETIDLFADRLARIVPFDALGVRWHCPERMWIRAANTIPPDALHRMRDALLAQRDETASHREAPAPHALFRLAALVLPLASGSTRLGAIRIERTNGPEFEPAETERLGIAATSLALALSHLNVRQELEQLAMRDGLTNVLNRRAFDTLLHREVKTAHRYRSPLCLVLGDIDHFKTVNDRFGHLGGDALLKEVATVLTESIRGADIVTRYGGEEFALILPRTAPSAALMLADRIRDRIEQHVFVVGGSTVRLTMSFGVAGFQEAVSATPDELIAAADHGLYQAKSLGRNRVVLDRISEERISEERVLCGPAGRHGVRRRSV